MKLARRTLSFHAWFLVLILGLMAAACGGPWRDGYFKKGVDRLTQEEIFEKMGPPHTAKTPALGGEQPLDLSIRPQRAGPNHVELLVRRRRFPLGHRLDGQGNRNR